MASKSSQGEYKMAENLSSMLEETRNFEKIVEKFPLISLISKVKVENLILKIVVSPRSCNVKIISKRCLVTSSN